MRGAASVKRVRPTAVGLLPQGRQYTVNDLGSDLTGYTDFVRKELGVVRDLDVKGVRFVQLHELSHVKLSEEVAQASTKWGLPQDHVNAAEDARIQIHLRRSVPDACRLSEADTDYFTALAREGKFRTDVAGVVSTYAGAFFKAAYKAASPSVQEEVDKIVAEIERLVEDGVDGPEFTHKIASSLAEHGGRKRGRSKGKGGRSEEDGLPERPGEEEEEEGPPLPDLGDTGHHTCTGNHRAPVVEKIDWTMPRVEESPLTKRLVRLGTHTYRSADSGLVLRDVCRLRTDGRIFGVSRKRPGAIQRGTILVDVSGSMSLTPADIESIIAAVPYATVAIYSGGPSVLQIVARNGRMMSPLRKKGGGRNECDGPALLWLSRQARPLVWVCDGYVTGEGDVPTPALFAEAQAIVESAGILHIPSMFTLASYLLKVGAGAKDPAVRGWLLDGHARATVKGDAVVPGVWAGTAWR